MFDDDVRDRPAPEATAPERIRRAMAELGVDELEVLVLVAERLAGAGRRSYGPLELDSDPRDFQREALEELADGAVYLACSLIRAGRVAAEQVEAAASTGASAPTPAPPTPPAPIRLTGADRGALARRSR